MPSLIDLTGMMKGKDCLSGWDVLVAYNQTQLNALLAERASKLKFSDPIEYLTEYVDDDETKKIKLNMTFSTPHIEFVDTSKTIQLIFGISGSWQKIEEKKTGVIPAKIHAVVSAPISSVEGHWQGDKEWKTKDNAKPQGDRHISIMDPGTDTTLGLCIDFTEQSTTVAIKCLDGSVPIARVEDLSAKFARGIKAYLRQNAGTRYCLSAVGNSFKPDDTQSRVLQPKFFCFTIQSDCLLTWIGLAGGAANEKRDPKNLFFGNGNQAISPIADGHTATIIFSQFTMTQLFLKPAIQASAAIAKDSVKDVLTSGEGGLKLEMTFASKTTTVPSVKRKSDDSQDYLDGTNIDLNENKASFICDAQRPCTSHNAVAISWSSSEKHLKWETSRKQRNAKGTGQWRESADKSAHPNLLGMDFTFNNRFDVKVDAESMGFFKRLVGGSDAIPPEYKELQVTAPKLNFEIKSLDYFLTTNVLLPGHHIFVADPPVPAEEQSGSGLTTPRDTVLTGRLATSLEAKVKRLEALEQYQSWVHESNAPALTNVAQTSGLERFKDDMLAFPKKTLFGDLLTSVASAQDGQRPSISGILSKHGFDDLQEVDLLKMWGTTAEDLLGPKPLLTAETGHVTELDTYKFDLRLFGGIYIVDVPAGSKGQQFIVNPAKGTIIMGSEEILPMLTHDEKTGSKIVQWNTRSGKTYLALFKLFWDQHEQFLGMQCSGSVQELPSSSRQDFSACTKGYPPRSMSQSEAAARDGFEVLDISDASIWLTIISSSLSILGVIGGCLYKRYSDSHIRRLQANYEGFINLLMVKHGDAARIRYKDHPGATEEIFRDIERRINNDVKKIIERKTKEDKEFWSKIQRDPAFKKGLSEELETAANERIRKEEARFSKLPEKMMRNEVQKSPFAAALTSTSRKVMPERFGKSEANNVCTNLTTRDLGGQGYSLSTVKVALQTEAIAQDNRDLESNGRDLNKVRQNLEASRRDLERKDADAQAARKRWEAELDPTEKVRLENELKEANKNLEDARTRHRDDRSKSEGHDREAKDLGERREKNEKERREAEKQAEQSKRDAHKLRKGPWR